MLIIRFVRIGRNKQAYFKLVAAEKARAVKKKYIAEIGNFDPHFNEGKGKFKFDAEVIKKHIANGAQMSQSVARKLVKEGLKEAGKFIIQRKTKPKKEAAPVEKKEAPAAEAPAEKKEE